ncbi:MAG: aminoglycoside phosphotransferase family protein [Bauldia sp.]
MAATPPDAAAIAAEAARYFRRWRLKPDGAALVTHSSSLHPVIFGGLPAMLKLPFHPEERDGGVLMEYWAGDGAAEVYDRDDAAILLERATGTRSLAAMARAGRDDEASRILFMAASRLHALRPAPRPDLVALADWFRELWPMAARDGGRLAEAARIARALLAEQQEPVTLHGDIHHDNVLDFGPERGWLAIDPKRLCGDRAFDFANIFTNPDLAIAGRPGRLERQLTVVAEAAALEPQRLLRGVAAWAGLSAAWWLGDGFEPELEFVVLDRALALLDNA